MASDEDITFYPSTQPPEEISESQRGFSVDVLIYSPDIEEHTIGWFNYNTNEWLFLCREANFKHFKWRYFTDKHDKF